MNTVTNIVNATEAHVESSTTVAVKRSLKKRYAKEKRFQLMGMISVIFAFLFLLLLLADIITKAIPAFTEYKVTMPVTFNAERLRITDANDTSQFKKASYRSVVSDAIYAQFPEVTKRAEKRQLKALLSDSADYQIRDMLINDPSLLGKTIDVTMKLKDDPMAFIQMGGLDTTEHVKGARLNEWSQNKVRALSEKGMVSSVFSWSFFTNPDSTAPEQAGIAGALVGTLLTITVTIAFAFPVGLAAAIYLEEYAPKNRITDLIEININNLAAVPSIVFGLLGLAVFINLFGIPRSTPLVGGLVLALMTLPTIIISSRAAIKAVPSSLKEAALGLGASHTQTVFHHVVPSAMPGILTGTIIGIAQAIGETAPLIMIGLIAFTGDIPGGFTDNATVMPAQIYQWSDKPEKLFMAKTSAAILVLLIVLACVNLGAVMLRRRFEKK